MEDRDGLNHFFDEHGGLKPSSLSLVSGTLADTLATIDDLDIAMKKRIITYFWEDLFFIKNIWEFESDFNNVTEKEAVQLTESLYENTLYWNEQAEGLVVCCPKCNSLFRFIGSLQEFCDQDQSNCISCGSILSVTEWITKSS